MKPHMDSCKCRACLEDREDITAAKEALERNDFVDWKKAKEELTGE